MPITLSPEIEAQLDRQVASGRFGTPDDVVRAALTLLEAQDSARLERLKAEIQFGIESAEAGPLYSSDEVFAELWDRHRQLQQQRT